MKKTMPPYAALLALLGFSTLGSHAAIVLTADQGYNTSSASVFTLDPESFSPGGRGVAATRNLRQTFQLPSTINVGEINLSLGLNGADGGLVIDIYEVADVNASSWTAGTLVHTLTVSTATDLPATTANLTISLSDLDVFSLSQRNSGTEGYGIEISNADGTTNIGNIRHSNNGSDQFAAGRYYDENGATNSSRDFGVSIVPVPEPSAALLGGVGVFALLRRRRTS